MIGAPLLVSWLKEIKKCQITQTNWNVSSSSWDLHNMDIIEEVLSSIKELLEERYNIYIFKNTRSPLIFLNHGEIDFLGLEIKSGTIANIYAINTSINLYGMKTRNKTEFIEKILKNMIRSAMQIYGYYDLSRGSIIFASTELHPTIKEELSEIVKLLNEVFKIYGFQFIFTHYINEELNDHISNSLLKNKSYRKIEEINVKKNNFSGVLTDYLQDSGCQVVDKRKNGGFLWVIGGKELEPIISHLSSRENVEFKFRYRGSISTNYQPAWFTKSKGK